MAPKVYIIIYTLYHHIYTLALEAKKGLEEAGVEASIFQGTTSALYLEKAGIHDICSCRDAL